MKISIRTKPDGTKIAVDDTGKPLDWVHAIQTDLDPTGRQVLFLATFAFGTEYNLGVDTPETPPAPPKAP